MKTKLKNRLSAPGLLEVSRVSFSRIRDRHGNRSSKNEHELKIEAVLFIYGSKSLYCH